MILASGSPRRQEILKEVGFNFKVVVPEIEEVSKEEEPVKKILDISRKKAMSVGEKYTNEYVLSADTVVVVDDKILGKPKNVEEAREYLSLLSGREHEVITAYTFMSIEKNIFLSDYSVSKVKFYKLDEETINWYIETGEYKDKAGAYGIQGKGRVLVENINGDFFSIMGFPVASFVNKLKEIGVDINEINKL
ncbi:nucleoside triphosphate pyrophosphatase [Fusobacterium massiliense]|uniref:Maf family protein n=1 Tax=Fusobacterium massiliense TaxID=1852365 RepID=UPI0028E9D7B5|nr:nucleoside triphosphate pyrophosphatase [Fusobacterium massiliense]